MTRREPEAPEPEKEQGRRYEDPARVRDAEGPAKTGLQRTYEQSGPRDARREDTAETATAHDDDVPLREAEQGDRSSETGVEGDHRPGHRDSSEFDQAHRA